MIPSLFLCAGAIGFKNQNRDLNCNNEEPVEASLPYDPFYMKTNRVYKPENFDGKLVPDARSLSQYAGESTSEYDPDAMLRLYDEIPEISDDQHFYDLPDGEPERTPENLERLSHAKDRAARSKNSYLYTQKTESGASKVVETVSATLSFLTPEHCRKSKASEAACGDGAEGNGEERFHLYDLPDDKEGEKQWLYDLNSVDKKLQEINEQENVSTQPDFNPEDEYHLIDDEV